MGGSLVLYYLITRKNNLKAAIASSPGLVPARSPSKSKYFAAKILSALFPTFQIENDLDIPGLSRDVAIVQKYQEDHTGNTQKFQHVSHSSLLIMARIFSKAPIKYPYPY